MDWDSENFVVPPTAAPVLVNKWDGEDEDDNVKDNWEDDEEEKKREEQASRKAATTAQPKKTKSKLQEKIEERERREQQRLAGNLKDSQLEDGMNHKMTAEELYVEKLRRQKLQEDADLEVAKEMLGILEDGVSVDKLNPKSKEEFSSFQDALCRKILIYKKSEYFPSFAEELMRNICANLQSTDIKKIKLTIDNVYNEKLKVEKSKQKPKAKGKAKLRMDGNNLYDEYSAYTIDEYDDFM